MRKILLGISVLFSLDFLAACGSGSSGSSGAAGSAGTVTAGATGDTGATGADGSIAVPSADSDLAVTSSATADTDFDLGEVVRAFYVSGLDNLSSSRVKY